MPLHQTTCDDDALDLALFFAANCVVNHFERLVFRCFEEAAGVDDDRVGALIFVDEFETRLLEDAEHLLAVDKVLRAAEADETHTGDVGLLLRHRKFWVDCEVVNQRV